MMRHVCALLLPLLMLTGCTNPSGEPTVIPYRTDTAEMIVPPVYYLPEEPGKEAVK